MAEEGEGAAAAEAPRPGRSATPSPATSAGSRPDTARTGQVAGPPQVQLTSEEVEQVIARAIELQQREERRTGGGLSVADVQDIAAQIGVDPSLIRRAVTDVRTAVAADHQPSATERLLGPRHVGGAALVPGDVASVRAATRQWMSTDEGMRCTGTRGATDRWTKDKRLLVEIRRGLSASRGSGVLRDLKAVTVDVAEDQAGTIVTIDADTTPIRNATTGVLGTAAAGAVGLGVAAAGALGDTAVIGSDVAQFAAAFSTTAAVGLGSAAVVARTWTRRVREAVDQALDGITMSTTQPDPPWPPPAPRSWRRTLTDWLGGG